MEKNIELLREKAKRIKEKKYILIQGVTDENREEIEKIFKVYKKEFNRLGIDAYLRICLNEKHEVNEGENEK